MQLFIHFPNRVLQFDVDPDGEDAQFVCSYSSEEYEAIRTDKGKQRHIEVSPTG